MDDDDLETDLEYCREKALGWDQTAAAMAMAGHPAVANTWKATADHYRKRAAQAQEEMDRRVRDGGGDAG